MKPLSVVIPAHNEEALIDQSLDRLLGQAADGEFEVVVVCNGCTDRTASRARAHTAVTVLETAAASKVDALNLGDRAVVAFPRLYLDADIALDAAGVRALASALDDDVLAVAPALGVDTTDASWAVRSYLRLWSRLPSVASGLAGRGAFMLSSAGRRRFADFPDIMADDLFIDRLFLPDERRVLADVASVVSAPHTVGGLISRKTRVFLANRQLSERYPDGPDGTRPTPHTNRVAWARVVRRDPRRIADLPAFLLVTVVAKWRARRRWARGDYSWDRDLSTRADTGDDDG